MVDRTHRYTSQAKQALRNTELRWGGTAGWEPELDQQEGIKLKGGQILPSGATGNHTFLEDFESGDLDDWDVEQRSSGFSWQLASEPTHSGNFAGRLHTDGKGSVVRPVPETTASGPYVVWIQQTADPYDDVKLYWKSAAEETLFRLNFNRETTQNVHVNHTNRGWKFPSNTWVRITVSNVDFGSGTYNWKIDREGGHVYDSAEGTFDPLVASEVGQFCIHASHYGRGTGNFYVDDISISDTN